MNDNALEQLLQERVSDFPGQARLRAQVLDSAARARGGRRLHLPRLLLAAALCAALATTTLAGQWVVRTIRQIAVQGADAAQVDRLAGVDGEPIVSRWAGSRRTHFLRPVYATYDPLQIELIELATPEEAQALLPFPIAAVGVIPEGYELLAVQVQELAPGICDETVTLLYQGPGLETMAIDQTYTDPDFRWNIQTVMDITQTTVNGHEALLFSDAGWRQLCWQEGDYAFQMSAGDAVGREELLAVAQSIRAAPPSDFAEPEPLGQLAEVELPFAIAVELPQEIDHIVELVAWMEDGQSIAIRANPSALGSWTPDLAALGLDQLCEQMPMVHIAVDGVIHEYAWDAEEGCYCNKAERHSNSSN